MMKKYRNTKTGVIIVTPCEVSGEFWEPVKGRKQKAEPVEEKQEEPEAVPDPVEQTPEAEQTAEQDAVEIGPKTE